MKRWDSIITELHRLPGVGSNGMRWGIGLDDGDLYEDIRLVCSYRKVGYKSNNGHTKVDNIAVIT